MPPKSKKITIKQRGNSSPLGDIAIGTTIIPNPNLLNLKGPKVSFVFKQTQSKKALEFLLSKANYGFVVQKDPSYNPMVILLLQFKLYLMKEQI